MVWRKHGGVLEWRARCGQVRTAVHAMTTVAPEAKVGLESYLLPPKTVVRQNGDSAATDISGSASRLFVCVLEITDIIEQESLDISLWGSADGTNWGAKPLLKFPQRFYRGRSQMALDLAERPEVTFLRARWEVNRWGRGSPVPMFEFSLYVREVSRQS